MTLRCLRLSDIPTEGMSLDCQVSAEDLDLAPTDVEACDAFSLQADIVPADKELAVRGVISGRVVRQCVRCLKDYEETLGLPFTARYHARKVTPQHPAKRAHPKPMEPSEDIEGMTEGEMYFYTGDHLDLVPMLREQIILAAPMQPLCGEGCRGLCPSCGQDRNVKPCGCVDEQLPTPFLILRGLREKSDESSRKN